MNLEFWRSMWFHFLLCSCILLSFVSIFFIPSKHSLITKVHALSKVPFLLWILTIVSFSISIPVVLLKSIISRGVLYLSFALMALNTYSIEANSDDMEEGVKLQALNYLLLPLCSLMCALKHCKELLQVFVNLWYLSLSKFSIKSKSIYKIIMSQLFLPS